MLKSKPIPVKLPQDLIDRLDIVSQTTGLSNRSQVIRLCVKSFLDYFEEHGEAALPFNWREVLVEMDRRTSRHHPQLKAAEKPGDYKVNRKPPR